MAAAARPATTYCNRADLEDRHSDYGLDGIFDDDADGTDDTSGSAVETRVVQGCAAGTNRVNFFLLARYDIAELALSPIACQFAVVHALKWLCARRGNPVPSSLLADCQEADEMMKMIQAGTAILPDAASRSSSMPSHMNVTIDRNYRIGKTRVVRQRSDPTNPTYPQNADYQAEYVNQQYR